MIYQLKRPWHSPGDSTEQFPSAYKWILGPTLRWHPDLERGSGICPFNRLPRWFWHSGPWTGTQLLLKSSGFWESKWAILNTASGIDVTNDCSRKTEVCSYSVNESRLTKPAWRWRTPPWVQTGQSLTYLLCDSEQVLLALRAPVSSHKKQSFTVHLVQYSLMAKVALGPFLFSPIDHLQCASIVKLFCRVLYLPNNYSLLQAMLTWCCGAGT